MPRDSLRASVSAAAKVSCGQIRVPLQKGRRLRIGFLAVVEHFAHFDDLQVRRFFRQYVAETHLAFLMAAIGQRAGEQRHLARTP